MVTPKVVLTNPIDAQAIAHLKEFADVVLAPDQQAQTLRALVHDADALVVRAYLPEDIFEDAPHLQAVVRSGVGVDMIPMDAANRHALPVANVPGVNAQAVAEHAVGAMINLGRHTWRMDRMLRKLGWPVSRGHADTALELHGKTVGIVGVGNVGRKLAEICHYGFGMQVLGYQRRLAALPSFVHAVDLDALFTQSDFVVLTCPLTPETKGLVNARRLGQMQLDACLVNVARGPVIDEDALVVCLRAGRIRGAALDVYVDEPLVRNHPLLALENVLLTPHVAGLTVESFRRMGLGAAEEVKRMLLGERPVNFVNPEIWEEAQRRRPARMR